MRIREKSGPLSVLAVAGTHVVILGFDLAEPECQGLLGFTIHRTDHTENEAYFLEGQKCFEATDPGLPSGASHTFRDHPYQSFQYGDYTAKPGHRYTYKVTARKGTPEALTDFAEVSITVETETALGVDHDIFFNRGVAASQAYVRRFGNKKPEDVPNHKAFDWLSRGLYEALIEFVMRDAGPATALRVAAYELHYQPLVDALKDAKLKGSDVQIIFDERKESPGDKNRAALRKAGLLGVSTPRKRNASYISHNKFIVRLTNGVAEEVWTGGTNFSINGIFGHSNVAHVSKDKTVAGLYHDYWNLLKSDPEAEELRIQVEALSAAPETPTPGTLALFSPRGSLEVLEAYARWAMEAKDALFMTFAFGISDAFQDVYRNSQAGLRFALLEKKTRSMKAGSPERKAAEKAIDDLRKKNENIFAIGGLIADNKLEGWLKEELSGLSQNVKYIHNKFMLIDPLSDDPIVVAGSANFSAASTTNNDENMLVVRGATRCADIYLGEYMRLYNHHAFRESLTFRKKGTTSQKVKHLRTDDWWRDFYNGSSREARRRYFS